MQIIQFSVPERIVTKADDVEINLCYYLIKKPSRLRPVSRRRNMYDRFELFYNTCRTARLRICKSFLRCIQALSFFN